MLNIGTWLPINNLCSLSESTQRKQEILNNQILLWDSITLHDYTRLFSWDSLNPSFVNPKSYSRLEKSWRKQNNLLHFYVAANRSKYFQFLFYRPSKLPTGHFPSNSITHTIWSQYFKLYYNSYLFFSNICSSCSVKGFSFYYRFCTNFVEKIL